jgi:uncharacterized protein (DUF2141 family)
MKYLSLPFNLKYKKHLVIFIFLAFFSVNSFAVNIIIDVRGLQYTKGNAIVSLYNSADSFAKEKKFFKQKTLDIRKETKKELLVVTFKDIPAGTYAIQIIHDKNKNGIIDTNLFGVPVEATGYSNNVKEKYGIPDFKDAAFTVGSTNKNVIIHVTFPY